MKSGSNDDYRSHGGQGMGNTGNFNEKGGYGGGNVQDIFKVDDPEMLQYGSSKNDY
jgi:hypothetical protein